MENKNRIKCLRKLHRLSQEEFAKQYNVAQTAVSNWEVFRNNIDISIATRIAEDYKVPVEFIYGFEFTVTRPIEQWYPDQLEKMNNANKLCRDFFLFKYGKGFFANTYDSSSDEASPPPSNIFPITRKRFRMLGDIACGEPRYADEDHETYIEASGDIRADFCLRAKGDSMIGARIQDGDIVFIRKQPTVEDGEIAVVIIDNEATLKRVKYNKEKQQLTLFPANDKYDPLVFIGEELDQIRILGKAVCFMSNL